MSIKQEQCTLPLEKVFSIQIGTELFRLSGASIASDGQSCLGCKSEVKAKSFELRLISRSSSKPNSA